MSSPRVDPFRAFNFVVSLVDSSSTLGSGAAQIAGVPVGGFSECSGLEMTLDVEEYREGGNNGLVLKFPSRVKWANLRLKRGLALKNDLWQWHYAFVQGQVKRRDGIIALHDEQQNPVKVWAFLRALPVKWSGPSMNATQNQVAIEELELAHEGLRLL